MMITIAYFIFLFTIVQFLIATVNVIFKPKLPKRYNPYKGLVSVLIPARNEEENIGIILNDLLQQDYKNIEIIVFNDQSSDQTAEIVEKFATLDARIKLIHSEGLPAIWLGKNYACYSLSKIAKGEYFLFLDADVRLSNDIIINSISYAQRYQLGLLSIFPKQIITSPGEKITVPNMNYILLSLLPLILVRKSKFHALAAANGQFMLFNAVVYRSLPPHEKMKDNKVEDIAIARFLKKEKHRIACLVGDETIRCRMYTGFKDAVNGFSKNVTAFFGDSLILSLLFWLTTTFGFLIELFFLPVNFFVFYIIVYLFTRIFISWVSEQKVLDNILYFFPQQLACGLFIYKALINKYNKNYQWKGRSIA
jgi:glycosyltransferase involved in cell wall biosynthesis